MILEDVWIKMSLTILTNEEHENRTEDFLDKQWITINMTTCSPSDKAYYYGALKALELMGYWCTKNKFGEHCIIKL